MNFFISHDSHVFNINGCSLVVWYAFLLSIIVRKRTTARQDFQQKFQILKFVKMGFSRGHGTFDVVALHVKCFDEFDGSL